MPQQISASLQLGDYNITAMQLPTDIDSNKIGMAVLLLGTIAFAVKNKSG